MTTRDQARETLASLNPAPIFLEAYRSPRLPDDLDIYFGCPEEFFLAPETQAAYTERRLIPILDDGNFGVVTFYDPIGGAFVQKYVESPDETRATFANWQQYLAGLMIDIAESIEDDDRLRRAAELVGSRHFDELMGFLAGHRGESSEEHGGRKARFIATIGG
jgi:hypothetical protein